EDALEPGDIVLYNFPYGTGSHPQDAAVVMPVFLAGDLIGYTTIKAHWLDIGGKEPYSTDTVDVFQEGTIFPGVKLFARGELVLAGSTVRLDYSRAPDAHPGPINCPIPSTVSASRIAITMLAGGGEAPNEGHFRPLEVITRPGSMFHPLPPSPCFLYGWPAI